MGGLKLPRPRELKLMFKYTTMKGRRFAPPRFILLGLLCCCLVSCAGTGSKSKDSSADRSSHPGKEARGRPYWINQQPADDDYYSGIGQSQDTGDPNTDRERARLAALNEMAQSISVTIMSEMRDERREVLGEYYEEVRISVRAYVDIDIDEAELVDTYYSEEDGYWAYYRLSKRKWEESRNRKMDLLNGRVAGLIEPAASDPALTLVDRLNVLSEAVALVLQSEFAGSARTELFNSEGYTLDLLVLHRRRLLSALSIATEPEEIRINPGLAPEIGIVADCGEGCRTGPLTVAIETVGGKLVDEVVTSGEGVYRGKISPAEIPFGTTRLTVRVKQTALGFPGKPATASIPQAFLDVYRRPVALKLSVIETEESGIKSLNDSARSVFEFLESGEEPVVQFVMDESGSDLAVVFTLHFRHAPKKMGNILVTYARAAVSVRDNGGTLLNYETAEFKDMGLDRLQAMERAVNRLIADLGADGSFQEKIRALLRTYTSG